MPKHAALLSEEDCPQRRLHTVCPRNYLAWHEWADKKSKKHYPVRCPGCGLFTIWKRKGKDNEGNEGEEVEEAGPLATEPRP